MRPLLNAEFHKYPYHGKLLREPMHSLQKPFPGSSKPYNFPFKKFLVYGTVSHLQDHTYDTWSGFLSYDWLSSCYQCASGQGRR